MSKEFIPYEQALELKELGFDEPCMCIYDKDGKLERSLIEYPIINSKNGFHEKWNIITAPLKQQVFRWFREKHGLQFWIEPSFKSEYQTDGYVYYVKNNGSYSIDYATYEEAEDACINKLIEIVKGGKQ